MEEQLNNLISNNPFLSLIFTALLTVLTNLVITNFTYSKQRKNDTIKIEKQRESDLIKLQEEMKENQKKHYREERNKVLKTLWEYLLNALSATDRMVEIPLYKEYLDLNNLTENEITTELEKLKFEPEEIHELLHSFNKNKYFEKKYFRKLQARSILKIREFNTYFLSNKHYLSEDDLSNNLKSISDYFSYITNISNIFSDKPEEIFQAHAKQEAHIKEIVEKINIYIKECLIAI